MHERTFSWSDQKLTAEAGLGLSGKADDVRGVTLDAGPLSTEEKVVQAGQRSAVAEGKVLDAKGRLCAKASTTCLAFDLPPV